MEEEVIKSLEERRETLREWVRDNVILEDDDTEKDIELCSKCGLPYLKYHYPDGTCKNVKEKSDKEEDSEN